MEENNLYYINAKKPNKKKKVGSIIIFAILDLLAMSFLFLVYGPISYFRDLWITSAMSTMNHKYLAYVFYNDNQIAKALANNTVIESGESTNVEEITFEEPVEYESEYERQILERDEGNDLYKLIDVQGDGYKGHLLVVYDPSKVRLAQYENLHYGGILLKDLVEKNDAVAGINASGFSYDANYHYSPSGTVILNGKIYCEGDSGGWGGGIIGFTEDNVLVLLKTSAREAINMGVRDAISFGPFLIVNGVKSEFRGNGGYGLAPRTAIGQRKDGIVLMLVIDGRRPGHSIGVDVKELANIMENYGAINAANLDGGGSSEMFVDGTTVNVSGGSGYQGVRYLVNGWIVKK